MKIRGGQMNVPSRIFECFLAAPDKTFGLGDQTDVIFQPVEYNWIVLINCLLGML